MNNREESMRATAREWRAALLVLIGGFAIAIAVAAYFTLKAPNPAETQEATAPEQAQQVPATKEADANAKDAMMVCAMELLNAKNFGIVPGYSQLASAGPRATNVRGRYTCDAATTVARYTIAGDLICRDLNDPRCVKLFSVTRDDGTVLYKRQG